MKLIQSGIIRVPATTANLGPGFDCLGMALDLWNEVSFTFGGENFEIGIEGEGSEYLSRTEKNLIVKAIDYTLSVHNQKRPPGLQLQCRNQIPTGSGLGSSASAVLAGIMAADALLGKRLTNAEIIALGKEIEGHADNIAPALLGGLTAAAEASGEILLSRYDVPDWKILIILPGIRLSTLESRRALPRKVKMKHAVKNIGRSLLTADAIRSGDQELLFKVMKDKIHQPYRLKLLQNAKAVLKSAQSAGIPGALSGAGPSLVFFSSSDFGGLETEAQNLFSQAGVQTRTFHLAPSAAGAHFL